MTSTEQNASTGSVVELLRSINSSVHCSACDIVYGKDSTDDCDGRKCNGAWERLAVMVDRELAEARSMRCDEYIDELAARGRVPKRNNSETLERWLDRCYIARPRFEDGTPVQFGDEIEIHDQSGQLDKGIIQSFHPNNGPVWRLSLVGCDRERLVRFDSETCVIKRPAPKVLDADGVEIEVGDVVWDYENGWRWKVREMFRPDERWIVRLDSKDGELHATFLAEKLTHHAPDSLEKLRDDLDGFMRDCEINADKVDEFTNRFTALIESGA